ncbi:MAG: hypothetical protein R6V58_11995 [Planctomycetota bacterium]
MTDWQTDKATSDELLPNIKFILGQYLIGAAPAEEDQQRNTDLIVLNMQPVRVACRIRRFEYLAEYRDEFTVRSGRPSGAKTELAKIVEGWGDYLFYGFASPDGESLAFWFLGDLLVFRRWYSDAVAALPAGTLPGTLCHNGDGSSAFRAFQLNDLPPDFVIAWGECPLAAKAQVNGN